MLDSAERRLLYIGVIALAIVPLVLAPGQVGGILSLAGLFFVILYIRSDRKRQDATRRGFPVILKQQDANGSNGCGTAGDKDKAC